MLQIGFVIASLALQQVNARGLWETSFPTLAELHPRSSTVSGCTELGVGLLSQPRTSYYNGQRPGCPIKKKLDPDGSCTTGLEREYFSGKCVSYCEVRNEWFWGQEVPLPLPPCRRESQCSITSGISTSISQSFSFDVGIKLRKRDNGGHVTDLNSPSSGNSKRQDDTVSKFLKGIFSAGASWTWTETQTSSLSETLPRPPSDLATSCGYWTSIPAFITSCGTLTTTPGLIVGGDSRRLLGRQVDLCDATKPSNTPNWCQTVPALLDNGKQFTATVFVKTDCTTNKPLPMEKQDEIYREPGVAINGS